MLIGVQVENGKLHELKVSDRATVLDLQLAIEEETDIVPQMQLIFYGGIELDDEHKLLTGWEMSSGAVVYLAI